MKALDASEGDLMPVKLKVSVIYRIRTSEPLERLRGSYSSIIAPAKSYRLPARSCLYMLWLVVSLLILACANSASAMLTTTTSDGVFTSINTNTAILTSTSTITATQTQTPPRRYITDHRNHRPCPKQCIHKHSDRLDRDICMGQRRRDKGRVL